MLLEIILSVFFHGLISYDKKCKNSLGTVVKLLYSLGNDSIISRVEPLKFGAKKKNFRAQLNKDDNNHKSEAQQHIKYSILFKQELQRYLSQVRYLVKSEATQDSDQKDRPIFNILELSYQFQTFRDFAFSS